MDVNLVLFKKDGSQKTFSLSSDVTVIGRRGDCDLRIPVLTVSRRHCQLSLNNGVLKIRDLGSRNGTYLNGKPVDEADLRAGDYIKIGPLTFELQIDGQPREVVPPQKLKSEAPKKQVPEEHALIDEESGSFIELLSEEQSSGSKELDESDSFLADLEDI